MKIVFKKGNFNGNFNNFPMPSNYAQMKNPKTGDVKIGKVGFSYTTLFFDLWPSIFRRDWYNFLCMLFVDTIVMMGTSMILKQNLLLVTQKYLGFFQLLWSLVYNMMYFRHLSNKGYQPANAHSRELLVQHHYIKA